MARCHRLKEQYLNLYNIFYTRSLNVSFRSSVKIYSHGITSSKISTYTFKRTSRYLLMVT
jgi:hypothetical protein